MVLPGADCIVETGWAQGTPTSQGYSTENQLAAKCGNPNYVWDATNGVCSLKPPGQCSGAEVDREKVIGDPVDDTQGTTNWPDPIVPGQPNPGIIKNRYHLNLPPNGRATIQNECPANYVSTFVSASGTDFFKCSYDDHHISCRNTDCKKGRDMDSIYFKCTCQTTPPPPPTSCDDDDDRRKKSCGDRDWDGKDMDLSKGKVRKVDGCTEWITDERFVESDDGYISVGKYNSCTKSWECAESFKDATQWKQMQYYNSHIPECNEGEVKTMKTDKDIMPHCSDSDGRKSDYHFSNR